MEDELTPEEPPTKLENPTNFLDEEEIAKKIKNLEKIISELPMELHLTPKEWAGILYPYFDDL
jgi:hypothetical protein